MSTPPPNPQLSRQMFDQVVCSSSSLTTNAPHADDSLCSPAEGHAPTCSFSSSTVVASDGRVILGKNNEVSSSSVSGLRGQKRVSGLDGEVASLMIISPTIGQWSSLHTFPEYIDRGFGRFSDFDGEGNSLGIEQDLFGFLTPPVFSRTDILDAMDAGFWRKELKFSREQDSLWERFCYDSWLRLRSHVRSIELVLLSTMFPDLRSVVCGKRFTRNTSQEDYLAKLDVLPRIMAGISQIITRYWYVRSLRSSSSPRSGPPQPLDMDVVRRIFEYHSEFNFSGFHFDGQDYCVMCV